MMISMMDEKTVDRIFDDVSSFMSRDKPISITKQEIKEAIRAVDAWYEKTMRIALDTQMKGFLKSNFSSKTTDKEIEFLFNSIIKSKF